ncbi:MAG TPA: PQQ-binding-like beta-propeller repeat protein [Solirubrobacteraceae bacterium]|jgi:outer membrane protein assembly factor BamB|nr:PQQ-binding-like beta-propeller repeat protein [Solirubrobacteraceae bacterium]
MPAATLRLARAAALAGASVALVACGASSGARRATPTVSASAIPAASAGSARGRLLDWPEFGLDAQRSGTSDQSSGITRANVARLRRDTVRLPGTVDSSPIYLHAVTVAGASRNVIVVTTSYGRTLAIDADTGRILWTFTPPGYAGWAGSSQITNTSPIADPGRGFVYAVSPDGLVHKLSLASGTEAAGWPIRVTRDATREKLGAALNIAGGELLVATSGYYGDAPPYQGHLVAIALAGGRIQAVYNTLCSDRRALIVPSTCGASDSAILSRGGAVVEPGGRRVLIDTGNGPWNGRTNFGDSVIELSLPGLERHQSFTPSDQQRLSESDTDLGSSAPALLGGDRVVLGGKDGVLRVLALSGLDGRTAGGARLGGEVQTLSTPGGSELFTAPAVWRHGGRTTVFIADGGGTAAYILRSGRLLRAWQNADAGTSPVLVGGLLYVYDPAGGGIRVYNLSSPRAIARLAGEPGHWNSPIVVDGHVIEPEGNANDHRQSGTLDIFSAG